MMLEETTVPVPKANPNAGRKARPNVFRDNKEYAEKIAALPINPKPGDPTLSIWVPGPLDPKANPELKNALRDISNARDDVTMRKLPTIEKVGDIMGVRVKFWCVTKIKPKPKPKDVKVDNVNTTDEKGNLHIDPELPPGQDFKVDPEPEEEFPVPNTDGDDEVKDAPVKKPVSRRAAK